jgi:hypothetical protein
MEKDFNTIEVNDKRSFMVFLELFLEDYKLNKDKPEWENNTLESFLDTMAVYTKVIDRCYKNIGMDVNTDIPSWRIFADIMRGAKVYE